MYAPRTPVPLYSLFFVFFRIGLFSFGGGLSGWIYRDVVTLRSWIGDDDFLSGLALAQVLPGANVTNLSIYIGQRLRGAAGAVIALLGLLTGPFFAVIGLVVAYDQVVHAAWIHDALTGAAAAAIGLMSLVALAGVRRAGRSLAAAIVLAVTFVCVGILQWPLVPVVFCLAPVSVAMAWPKGASDAE